ncbi:MAG: alkaline phosphatase PhoX [Pseudomonadota bacterium]
MTTRGLDRRRFLQAGLAVAGCFALGRDFWKRAYAAPAVIGSGPYGALLPADANGLMLPQGFSSRVIATAYSEVLRADGSSTGFTFPRAPDGGGVIPQADGGWIYVINSEIPIVADECADDPTSPFCGEQGGCSAIRFDSRGQVVDAYPILEGTNNNCAGGVTPWGTWLSCEENFGGFVYECDPTALNPAVRLAAMGQFNHEAAAVDPVGKAIYLSEDAPDSAFYRFIPAVWPDDGAPNLLVGTLEVAVVGSNPPMRVPYGEDLGLAVIEETAPGSVTWMTVPNPVGLPIGCKDQIPTAAIFKGGEGIWYDDGMVFFTCKGSNRVWGYDTVAATIDIVYDAATLGPEAPLTGVDNLLVHPASHDLLVAEDGGNMEVVLVTHEARVVAPLLRYPIPHSELTGLALSPDGTRLYVASQAKRHSVDEATGKTVFGEIFEISGPFRGTAAAVPTPTPTPVPVPGLTPAPSPAPAPGTAGEGRFGGGAMGFGLGALTAAALLKKVLATASEHAGTAAVQHLTEATQAEADSPAKP